MWRRDSLPEIKSKNTVTHTAATNGTWTLLPNNNKTIKMAAMFERVKLVVE
jgi:hypothetical protein